MSKATKFAVFCITYAVSYFIYIELQWSVPATIAMVLGLFGLFIIMWDARS